MPMANPLINGGGGRTAPPVGGSPVAPPPSTGGGIAMPVNIGPLRSEGNLPLHVGTIVLIALGTIVLLQLAGFKFVVAGSAGIGR